MTAENHWKQFFDAHARVYEEEVFTKDTRNEAAFLLEVLALPAGSRILDMGCGTGRHAIALAQAGMHVTGVDISAGMLAEARRAAQAAGVAVEWVQVDARRYTSEPQFDAAVSLCEGALCLLTPGDDPLERDLGVLRNMSDALKPGGRLVITVLNAYRMIRRMSEDDLRAGIFELETLTEPEFLEFDTAQGVQRLPVRERYYTPPEIARMLMQVGIAPQHLWGGTAGDWGRRPLQLDEMELMAVGRKG